MMIPRLDVLIYSHDGRGLGHASRSIGIGLALRRLYPELKVLFVSGCSFSQEMIGAGPLDWLKLPSYKTEVVAGKSRGVDGNSGFSDGQLGELRAQELAYCITLYRPRVVLADHAPQGKHRELVEALEASSKGPVKERTRWLLGVRGVVGEVTQVKSSFASEIFKNNYSGVLWYGDSRVLGREHCQQLQDYYGVTPLECGYVLRLAEFCKTNKLERGENTKHGVTVSVPWLGEQSFGFLQCLAAAIRETEKTVENWHLFIDFSDEHYSREVIEELFAGIANCKIEPPSANYAQVLLQSKAAVIYGGYNSLMDVLYADIPAIVILRAMRDSEQQTHLRSLQDVLGDSIVALDEQRVTTARLAALIRENLSTKVSGGYQLNLKGAENVAHQITTLIREWE